MNSRPIPKAISRNECTVVYFIGLSESNCYSWQSGSTAAGADAVTFSPNDSSVSLAHILPVTARLFDHSGAAVSLGVG